MTEVKGPWTGLAWGAAVWVPILALMRVLDVPLKVGVPALLLLCIAVLVLLFT